MRCVVLFRSGRWAQKRGRVLSVFQRGRPASPGRFAGSKAARHPAYWRSIDRRALDPYSATAMTAFVNAEGIVLNDEPWGFPALPSGGGQARAGADLIAPAP